ncbi:MAG: sulfotransferase [Cyanobacteria bacterium P01_F01_bin.86]
MTSQSTQQYTFAQVYSAYRAGQISVSQAREAYQKFLQLDGYQPKVLNMLGVLAIEQSDFIDAVGWISQAIAHNPDNPTFHHNLATVLQVLGNFEDAEYHYARTLKLRPDYAEAYFNFADTRRFQAEDDLVKMLAVQLETVDQKSLEDRCFLHFAAGKIYQDLKDYPRAFAHFKAGNEASNVVFDREQHDALIQRSIEICDRTLFEAQLGSSTVQASPIFIVGMPRSGTTLTESILNSHPMVKGLGELPHIRRIARRLLASVQKIPYPECLQSVSPGVLNGFAEGYLKRTVQLAPKAKFTVDKLPGNFMYLGLIALLFPNAKIIHCQRHPLDTCLSCYFKKFRNGQEFSFDLEDLGYYFLTYKRLMQHWAEVLPIPIFQLTYEQLVQEQAQVSRELLAFCELPWDEACLAFNKRDRPVQTASNWQVRQPLYASSVNRWQRYETELAPLRAILNL